MSFTGKLKKFEKTFKTAKKRAAEEGGFGSELPDGKYKARLESCSLGEAQSSGRIQVDFGFKVIAGEEKGEKIHKYQAVETEDDQVWLARDFRRFGIEAPESAKDLEDIVELLDGSKPELVISLKTKDSGQFCYIDKVTSEIDSGKFAAENDDDDDDGSGNDDDGDEVTVEVGMDIEFKSKTGKQLEGKIIKILDDDESVKVKTPKGNIHVIELDNIIIPDDDDGDTDNAKDSNDGDGDEDDGDTAIEIGMRVNFESESGKDLQGKIVKILEDEELVKVKTPKGKVYRVKLDDLTLPDDDDGDGDDGDGDEDDDKERKAKAKSKTKPKAKVKAKPKVKKRKR